MLGKLIAIIFNFLRNEFINQTKKIVHQSKLNGPCCHRRMREGLEGYLRTISLRGWLPHPSVYTGYIHCCHYLRVFSGPYSGLGAA